MRWTACSARSVGAGLAVCGLLASWVAMAELLQDVQTTYPKPWAITYVVHSGYMLVLPAWALLRYWRAKEGRELAVSSKSLAIAGLVFSVLGAVVAATWYISLTHTTVGVNNAIYQSSSAFVFLFSLMLLGEGPTLLKLTACALSLGGVAVVTFGPGQGGEAGGSGTQTNTPAGIAWVLLSTVLYSLYEVAYARITTAPSERHPICGRGPMRTVGHGASTVQTTSPQARSPRHASQGEASGTGEERALLWTPTASAALSAWGRLLYEWTIPISSPRGQGGSSSGRARPLLWRYSAVSTDDDAASDDRPPSTRATDPVDVEPDEALGGPADPEMGKLPALAQPSSLEGSAGSVSNPLDKAEMAALVLGCMGIGTAFLLWPVFFLADHLGWEKATWPNEATTRTLALNAALDSVYNICLLLGIGMLSPLSMSLATMLVVPVGVAADWAVKGAVPSPAAAVGCGMLCGGFILMQMG